MKGFLVVLSEYMSWEKGPVALSKCMSWEKVPFALCKCVSWEKVHVALGKCVMGKGSSCFVQVCRGKRFLML